MASQFLRWFFGKFNSPKRRSEINWPLGKYRNNDGLIFFYHDYNIRDDNDMKKPELREDLKNWIEFDQSNSNYLKVERGVEL